nr:C-C motif chemokine 13-like [Misgurnus anguillicaudatus]
MSYSYISLLVGLIVTWLQCDVTANNRKLVDGCCFLFRSKIPINKIDSYLETSHECPIAGVVFITKKSLYFCVDPNANWVKRAMQQIDERQHPYSKTAKTSKSIKTSIIAKPKTTTIRSTTAITTKTAITSTLTPGPNQMTCNINPVTSNVPVHTDKRKMPAHTRPQNTASQNRFCLCTL